MKKLEKLYTKCVAPKGDCVDNYFVSFPINNCFTCFLPNFSNDPRNVITLPLTQDTLLHLGFQKSGIFELPGEKNGSFPCFPPKNVFLCVDNFNFKSF